MNHSSLREECCEANILLKRTGLVDLTFGNVSVVDRATGVMAIKPSGVPYDQITPASMVLMDLEGTVMEGKLNPSSDAPTHRRMLKAFPEVIRSVVHTHSRAAVAFAQAGLAIPCFGTTHADHFHGPVPVTRAMTEEEILQAYEWETGGVILESFRDLSPVDVPAVLVRGHGPFVWGTGGLKAVEYAQALELVAVMALDTLRLSPQCPPLDPTLLDKHFFRKHGPTATYGNSI
ncbi:MAG: L-ribulose-5-phosphate 4-epimerase AraD [Candidatus Methylacidiphilales bacterium]|nr:L-ribulose-5-phosphate 4-epimerase AraD [Candidatus Methylacidiphilales bacterium]